MRAKAAIAAMELARRRGELLDAKWAKDSLSYLLVVLRQRVMSFSHALPRQLVGKTEFEMGRIIDAEARSLLDDLGNMPDKVTNPNWLRELERAELGLEKEKERPQMPGDHQAKQAKAQILRQKKTATMRKLRAEGRTA